MPKAKDLTGLVTGKLKVIGRAGSVGKYTGWLCACECGVSVIRSSNVLTRIRDRVKSCGCSQFSRIRNPNCVSNSTEYSLWNGAKTRARRDGRTFAIELSDIQIPDRCPVLDIPLRVSDQHRNDFSPSLDRIDSTQGYTKDNIQVISWRANKIKNDASIEELQAILKYMMTRHKQGD